MHNCLNTQFKSWHRQTRPDFREFSYSSIGLLDETGVKFIGRQLVEEFFGRAGFEIVIFEKALECPERVNNFETVFRFRLV